MTTMTDGEDFIPPNLRYHHHDQVQKDKILADVAVHLPCTMQIIDSSHKPNTLNLIHNSCPDRNATT
jgi:hypothetical protein